MLVLGIETSCDETSASVVDSNKNILSLVTLSHEEQKIYGGVVPEISARKHLDHISDIVQKALDRANVNLNDLNAIAATGGPGLIGGVIIGTMIAKTLASVSGKKFIAVNHLEGHALTARLEYDLNFPYLLLLVSGGHCQVLEVNGVGQYKCLGSTIDDAVGEAFDKVGKMLGIEYPAGPQIELLALKGDPKAYNFPRPLIHMKNCDFSFSGLKTAVKRTIDKITLNDQTKYDICASFQAAVGDILANKIEYAISLYPYINAKNLVVGGGVAANMYVRERLENALSKYGFRLHAPSLKLCTDNAAMIAWVGVERMRLGLFNDLSFEPRSRWPLTNLDDSY